MSVKLPKPQDAIHEVVSYLGILALLGLSIIGVLAALQRPIPDILNIVTVGALTALSGILARPSNGNVGNQAADNSGERLF